MIIRREYQRNWGRSLNDIIEFPNSYGGLRLTCLAIANESQESECFVSLSNGPQDDFQLLGSKRPIFFSDDLSAPLIRLSPSHYYASNLATAYVDKPNPDNSGNIQMSNVHYGDIGAFLSVNAYYGGCPPSFVGRRDVMRRYHTVSGIPTSAPTTVFRNIVSGRDAWELVMTADTENVDLVWTIYGCTENDYQAQDRIALATGTGATRQQGSRGYDAIELDLNFNLANNNAYVSFYARDW